MQLKGKTVIVTGASKGTGKSIVLTLLDNGVKVAGWSRSNPGIKHPCFTFD